MLTERECMMERWEVCVVTVVVLVAQRAIIGFGAQPGCLLRHGIIIIDGDRRSAFAEAYCQPPCCN